MTHLSNQLHEVDKEMLEAINLEKGRQKTTKLN